MNNMRAYPIRTIANYIVAAVSVCAGALAAVYISYFSAESAAATPVLSFLGTSPSCWTDSLWAFSAASVGSASILYLAVMALLPCCNNRPDDYGSAHWATNAEIKASGLLAKRGVVVGALKHFRKTELLRYQGEGHIIVVSPTRSGKGVTAVVPTALTWEHSVLFNDIKGELWALSAGWRKKCLKSVCLRFDATCADGKAARWNPLYEIRPYPYDVRDAQNIALTLTTSDSSVSRSDNERHWRVMGARLIKAVILQQLYVGRDKTLPGCYRLLTSTNRDFEDTLLVMLRTEHDPELKLGWIDCETEKPTPTHPAVAHVARDMLSKSDRERSSIVSSAVSYLEAFDDPIMAKNISESDFSLSDLMNHERPVSLYLTTPVADLERVQPLHRLFFTLAGTRNTEHLDFKDGRPVPSYKHPLLEVFDECAHLGYTPVIQRHFSLASGFGIQGMFVFQDFSQLFELYGRNESITSNCDVKVAFAPNNIETAGYLSKLLGTETREKKDSQDAGFVGRRNKSSKQSLGRPLLTPDECARLPKDKSIIIRNGFPPILGDKVPYYEIPELLRRSRIEAPESDKLLPRDPYWIKRLAPKASSREAAKTSEAAEKPKVSRPTRSRELKAAPKPQTKQVEISLTPIKANKKGET